MRRSGWLRFSAVAVVIAGIVRVRDAIGVSGCSAAIPHGLRGAPLVTACGPEERA